MTMASTEGPEAEFEDPLRKKLLGTLKDALPADIIRPTAWACLWLSDIDELKSLVAQAQETPTMFQTFLEGVEVTARLVPMWTQRQRPSSATSTPQNPSTPPQPFTPLESLSVQSSRGQKRNSSGQVILPRSKLQGEQCRQRDQRKCVLTNAGEPIEVAHIYPYSMRYEDSTIRQQKPSFWNILRLFWSKERIDTWYNTIFCGPNKTEVCQNLLCLSPHAHAYWERAYFALKPMRISDDKKRLDVQFFWLSPNPHVPGVAILQPPSLSALDQGPNLTRLFDNKTCAVIKSGDEICLETDDPVSRPLPDFNLLEMQWFLHRVTAMSGAAEPQDDFHYEDSNNDFMLALQDRLEEYTEDDWDMEVGWDKELEEERNAEYFEEGRSLAQPIGVHTVGHMVTLRGGGHHDREDYRGELYEGEDCEDEEEHRS